MAANCSPVRVVGRYALYNQIAAGGMATIHLGRLLGPVGFARTVAVKRLHPQFAKDPEFVSMFLDEARLAARVQHPNVVATIDVVATDGELFLIMDYVRGESLSKLLRALRKARERVPPRIATAIMCGFLHGLHAAHEAKNERGERLGLVHRDVSPQNVLVGADGIARVLDFGIAKAQGRIQVTRDGQIKGKLAYMPPEQLSGKELTRAVDIYASAVVMWETLTGERLFKSETEGETLAKILRDPVLPPSAIAPELEAFDAPILRALSRDARMRHATARELALEFERCCGIASSTEVGEWVEAIAGRALNAREEQIAEIESSSATMAAAQSVRSRMASQHESDSELSAMSVEDIISASSPSHTALMGSGPSEAQLEIFGRTPSAAPRPKPRASTKPAATSFGVDDGTSSRTHTVLPTRMLTFPVERKLPMLASVSGVLVLVLVVGVILAGKFSSGTDAKIAVEGHASASPSMTAPITKSSAVAVPMNDGPSNTHPGVSDPPTPGDPSASAEPVAAASDPTTPIGDSKPSGLPTAMTGALGSKPGTNPPGHPQTKTSATPSKPSSTPTAAPTKKSCDPPYTIDPQGRRKYKLECM